MYIQPSPPPPACCAAAPVWLTISPRLSARHIFLARPQALSVKARSHSSGDTAGGRRATCGSSSEARAIGPAISCGKNETNGT